MGEGRSFLTRVVLSVLAGNTYNMNETVYRQAANSTGVHPCCVCLAVLAMNSKK